MVTNLFKIGGVDLTPFVVAEGYDLKNEPLKKKWTDMNGIDHEQTIREKVSGSLNFIFKNKDKFDDFLYLLESTKDADGACMVRSVINNAVGIKEYRAVLTISPVRRLVGLNEQIDSFKMTVREL